MDAGSSCLLAHPLMVKGSSLAPPAVHDQLLGLSDVDGEVVLPCQVVDLSPVDRLAGAGLSLPERRL